MPVAGGFDPGIVVAVVRLLDSWRRRWWKASLGWLHWPLLPLLLLLALVLL